MIEGHRASLGEAGFAHNGDAYQQSEREYRKGYSAPNRLRDNIAAAHQTKLWRTVSVALTDHAVAGGLTLMVAWSWVKVSPGAGLAAAVPALVGVARQLRGLENLAHEGSHSNWSRRHRKLNDALAYALAAFPTGQRLSSYRASHLRHHGKFGTDEDPDMQRYRELGIEEIDRECMVAFAKAVAVRLVRYQLGWLRELGTDLQTSLTPLVWAVVAVGIPCASLLGPAAGVVAAVCWLFAMLFTLPVIRFIAEADEHSYRGTATVFDATISNLGTVQRFLFHPHADGYHTVHHMWPGIPHHALSKIHALLMAEDPNFAQRIRVRTQLLMKPSTLRVEGDAIHDVSTALYAPRKGRTVDST
ncbi:fatty acid desaturase family protein [Nocardia brasiliensis]|uniref:fatty acid desaturase family protein n=1 Tax=Nocardia brasiliensis TaxID=37326 RepID=UPI00366AADB5